MIGRGEKPCLRILSKKWVLVGDRSVQGAQDHQSVTQASPALLSPPGLGHLCSSWGGEGKVAGLLAGAALP